MFSSARSGDDGNLETLPQSGPGGGGGALWHIQVISRNSLHDPTIEKSQIEEAFPFNQGNTSIVVLWAIWLRR